MTSGRASSVGTDNMNSSIPHNSSRVALNNEWRNSYDQGSDLGRGMGISEVAPGKEGYGHNPSQYGDEIEKESLGQNYVPIPPSSPAVGMNEKSGGSYSPGPREAPAVIVNRTNRLEWIDGLRGMASVIIFTHHFSDLTWSQRFPDVLREGSLEGFLRFV